MNQSKKRENRCLHDLIARAATANPDAIAVVFEDSQLSYRELENKASVLAAKLQQLDVKPDSLIPICVERSLEIIVGIYGILKAGAAYLPMDPDFPQSRIDYILDDSEATVVVSNLRQSAKVQKVENILNLDNLSQTGDILVRQDNAKPHNLAYVIYTSGSTGMPKGVCIEHGNIVHYIEALRERLAFTSPLSHASASSPVADAGNGPIFAALTTGGTLHLLSQDQITRPKRFADYMERRRPDTLKIVPSLLATLQGNTRARNILPKRQLILGGESAQREWVVNWASDANGCEIHNHYGPTETTVGVCTYKVGNEVPVTESNSLPIGFGLSNTELYIVDSELKPVPDGTPGELLIGGKCVGRGYWNRPEITKESFISHPFSTEPEARCYRSGDRCQRLEDGSIEFLGRIDHQVKIRGNRVELGEIQTAILKNASVQQCVVTVYQDSQHLNQLTAYLVFKSGNSQDESAIRTQLKAALPDYMIPAAFVVLDKLPLTPNGKVDRGALPKPQTKAHSPGSSQVTLETDTEKKLAGIWEKILSSGPVSRDDHFIDLGGNSLHAIRLIGAIRETFFVDVTLGAIFNQSTLKQLAILVDEARVSSEITAIEPIPRIERKGPFLLSTFQENILLETLRNPDRPTYNEVSTIHLGASVNIPQLQRALNGLIKRHEILRTTFEWESGTLFQIIQPDASIDFFVKDFRNDPGKDISRHAEKVASEWSSHPFDLKKAPLIRAFVGIHSDTDHRLYLVFHHITGDGVTSNDVILNDLWLLYNSDGNPSPNSALARLDIQYVDFARWQRNQLENSDQSPHLKYWKEKLGQLNPFEFPPDHPRPQKVTHMGARKVFHLSEDLTESVNALAQSQKTTRFIVLLTAFKILMHRLTQEEDVVIGSVMSARNHPQVSELAGCFLSFVTLRTTVDGSMSTEELLIEVRRTLFEAAEHQDVSVTSIQEILQLPRESSRHPLYQVMFLMEPPRKDLEIPWTSNRLEFYPGATKLDLTFELDEREGHIFGRVEFNTDLFKPETMERLIGQYQILLEGIARSPQAKLLDLPLMTSEEESVILHRFNDTFQACDKELRLQDGLASFAKRTPDAIATQFGNQRMSYRELNQKATNIAFQLQKAAVGPNQLVAVVARRSLSLPVALFGILKSGAAYLPIDPDQPDERIQYLLEDSRAKVVLRDSDVTLPENYEGIDFQIAALAESIARNTVEDSSKPEDLAYVIYTSGSTGKPKGAMIEHRSIVNRLLWMANEYGFLSHDVQIQKTPTTFDVSVHELFLWSLTGGRLVLAPIGAEKDPAVLIKEIRDHGVTQIHFVPSMLEVFLGYLSAFEATHALSTLKNVYCSGEALPIETVTLFQQLIGEPLQVSLHNLYGPTEAAVDVSYFDCSQAVNGHSIPIGKPVWNTQLYVLDNNLHPLPIGIPGELYIGGAQVGRGYLHQAELTSKTFLPDPFSNDDSAKIYKTGDWVRWLEDGNIEYLGRNDFQIKVRGIRIEPGEIESAIRQFPGVSRAVVIARQPTTGDSQLIGYYTLGAGVEGFDKQALRESLVAALPEHLVPARLLELESFPLNASGKLDRTALPDPEWTSESDEALAIEGIDDPLEGILASIWTRILNRKTLDRKSGFFEQGGHSLSAVTLLGRVRSSLKVSLTLPDFLDSPTFDALLKKIRSFEASKTTDNGIEPRSTKSPIPVSWGQRRWWFLHQMDQTGVGFNIAYGLLVVGPLDVDKLEAALLHTVSSHEALRTVFVPGKVEPLQLIRETGDKSIHVSREKKEILSIEAECKKILEEEWNRKFDLEKGPLFFARIITFSKQKHFLTFSMHHIIADEAAEKIIYESLSNYYNGTLPSEKSTHLQIGDFSVWERSSEVVALAQAQAKWWKTRLEGAAPVLELPGDYSRPKSPSYTGDRVTRLLDQDTTENFIRMVRSNDATLFMGFQTAWSVFLGKLCDTNDVVIGAPVSLRNSPGLENTIGFLLNSVPFRTTFSEDQSFDSLLSETRSHTLHTYRHTDLPFEQIVDLAGPRHAFEIPPIFQVMLVMNGERTRPPALNGLETQVVKTTPKSAKLDLTLFVTTTDTGLELKLEYRTDLFDSETAALWLEDFTDFLKAITVTPAAPLASLNLVSGTEKSVQANWSSGEKLSIPDNTTLFSLVEKQLVNSPDNLAIQFESGGLTYQQLAKCLNSWSSVLLEYPKSKDRTIGICFDRSAGLLVALLTAMRIGAAYVPIDPSWPKARLSWFLKDSGVDTILAGTGENARLIGELLREDPALNKIRVTEIDSTNPEKGMPQSAAEATGVTPDDLAYMIYTSGSTGKPKGVLVEHRNAVASTLSRQAVYQESPEKFLLLSPPVFDSSVAGIFWTLTNGGTLVVPPKGSERNVQVLAEIIKRDKISHYLCLPSLHQNLLDYLDKDSVTLKTVIVAGEPCPVSLPSKHRDRLPNTRLFNEYGPTECTVWCTAQEITGWNGRSPVPIGRPIPNSRVYVVDRHLRLLPRGAKGEIVVGGSGLARGYHNRPELTKERFVECEQAIFRENRLYRTGDMGRWLKDGTLEFKGRADDQVKVRGYRIEPGEIEAALENHPDVEQAVVVAHAVSIPTRQSESPDIDLETLVANSHPALLAELVEAVQKMSATEIRNELGLKKRRKDRSSVADERVIRDDFRLEFYTEKENFINPPRKAQRNWIIGQAFQEFADDLEYLDKIAKDFAKGRDLSVSTDLSDISHASLSKEKIMEDWQTPVMQAMVEYATESGGDILEVGFGRGISAEMIQRKNVRSHTIIEVNDHSIDAYYKPWRKKYADRDIRLVHALWQDAEPNLGMFDGIFFHAFPLNEKEYEDYVLQSVTFAEHSFPVMAKHLKPGGAFTYLTLEVDSMARRHQRLLFEHFSSITTRVIPVNVPDDTADAWWAKTMVIVKAVK